MSVCYQNGPEIEGITMRGLNFLSLLVGRNQYRLSAQLLADRSAWADIYTAWIMACVDYMWFMDHGDLGAGAPKEEQIRVARLFQEDADAEACDAFLERYKRMLTKPQYPNVGSAAMAEKICGDIHRKMDGAPLWLCMRVSAVCLLTNSFPEAFFSEGAGWTAVLLGPILAARYAAGVIDVAEGLTLELDPCAEPGPEAELVPGTLMNRSREARSMHIRYDGIDHPIKLAPHGFLRAVFSDSRGSRLVSLKGCISCCDAGSAIIQKGEEGGSRLFYAYRTGGAFRLVRMPLPGPFWDAAADEMNGVTGAVVLTADELYSTVDPEQKLQRSDGTPLPIRCYRSGSQWARLYDDGILVSNLAGGEVMEGVTAVAEEAGRGLLVCRGGRFFDYRSNEEREMTEGGFVQAMLGRFLQAKQDECEVLATQFMRWTILDSGEVR